MIRLHARHLIVPRGDTGAFMLPAINIKDENSIAVFSLYDKLTHKTVVEKIIPIEEDKLIVSFAHKDTINLEPKQYLWDIKIYNNPFYDEDGLLIDGEEVNSYYAAFKLPICEIKEVAQNV